MMPVRLMTRTGGGLSGLLILCAAALQAGSFTIHEFAGGSADGANPYYGVPYVSGSTLYGLTRDGGAYGAGTAFRMNADGTGFTVLHTFAGGERDGDDPYGSLTLSGSTFYGMTALGGLYNWGTVFKMNLDGTGLTLLHHFTSGGSSDGRMPLGSLTLSGSTLYGMSQYGGSSGNGAVFKINTDGTGFGLLHSFAGGGSDGANPQGDLTIFGSTAYGMTSGGGDTGRGTVFKINLDGTGFALLHEFGGGINDGAYPYQSLTLSDTTLYGMTSGGGDSDRGTVFKMSTDGTGFGLLHEFAGGANDGRSSFGSLTLSDTTLYGMTYAGGDTDQGTIFQLSTDGTGFGLLHEFAGGSNDGAKPSGSLTLSDSTLYGMTLMGGDGGYGTVFQLAIVPEPPSLPVTAGVLLALALLRRFR